MPLPADRLPATLRSLPAKVAELERQLKELRASKRLAHSSIDGGSVTIRDTTGAVRAVLGNQVDGTVALMAVTGPVPPAPSDPTVTAQLAALSVTWDGTLAGGVALPADWMRVEVHVSATAGFTPDQTTLRQTIETSAGGTVLIALAYSTWYVILRCVTTSGAVSAPSNAVAGTPRQADAGDITATAITGKTITGGTIQTDTADPALRITNDGFLRVYLASGAITMEVGGPLGDLISHNQTGVNLDFRVENGIVYLGTAAVGTEANLFAESDGKTTQLLGNTVSGSSPVRARFKSSATRPALALDSGGALPVDLAVTGYVSNGTTWQTPGYGTGWSGNTGFNGSLGWQTLRYRIDAEDNLWLVGAFKVGAGASTTIFTVPNHPATQSPLPCFSVLSGVFSIFPLTVTTAGAVSVSGSAGGSIASGREYLVNAKVPLGNIT